MRDSADPPLVPPGPPRTPLRMDRSQTEEPEPELCGEFTSSSGVRCSVHLSATHLSVDGKSRAVLSLRDCVGCRAFRGSGPPRGDPQPRRRGPRRGDRDPRRDAAAEAHFSAVFYPPRRRCWSSRAAAAGTSTAAGPRTRVELCFGVADLQEAESWAGAVRDRAARVQAPGAGVWPGEAGGPGRRRRMMLLVNPESGKGAALSRYNSHIQQMLRDAGVANTLVITERQNHARELVREADLSQWDALVIISGDGLLYEVINGLLDRSDWEDAVQTPLGILPGGSGNALAASLHRYCGGGPVSGEELLLSCGFLLCQGAPAPMDLVSVQLPAGPGGPGGPGGPRLFSFLSLAWGFVADVDIESEKYRHVGAARFTVGTLVRLASLRVYKGRLAYLPASRDPGGPPGPRNGPAARCGGPASPLNPDSAQPRRSRDLSGGKTHLNSCHSNNSLKVRRRTEATPPRDVTAPPGPPGPPDSLLPPLDRPVPADWVTVPDEDFVLVLAMYQSHLAEDLLAAPDAALDDGVIHLFYVRAGISRAALLRLFLAMEKGAHLAARCPHLSYVAVRALRLEPRGPRGVITVDGEVVGYGPVQAQVHGRLARLISGRGHRTLS